MSFVKSALLLAGGAAIGGVVAAGATVKAITDYVRSDEFWNDAHPRTKTKHPLPYSGYPSYPNLEKIVFESRRDADLVLDELEGVINAYGKASVADFYDLAGKACTTFSANKYGWTDIRTVKVVRIREGYIIKFPRPIKID